MLFQIVYLTSKIKTEIVLFLLRGTDMESLSREYGVSHSDISTWRDQFIENGVTGFIHKPDDARLGQAERKIGQLQMEIELIKKRTNW